MEKAQQGTYISVTKTDSNRLFFFFSFLFFCIFKAKIVDVMNVIPKTTKQSRSLT